MKELSLKEQIYETYLCIKHQCSEFEAELFYNSVIWYMIGITNPGIGEVEKLKINTTEKEVK